MAGRRPGDPPWGAHPDGEPDLPDPRADIYYYRTYNHREGIMFCHHCAGFSDAHPAGWQVLERRDFYESHWDEIRGEHQAVTLMTAMGTMLVAERHRKCADAM